MPVSLAPCFEFTTGKCRGFIRPKGHYHGLVLTAGVDGAPLTRSGACTLNLEHYCARGRGGPFVPRDHVRQEFETSDHSVTITFHPGDDWHLTSRIRYEVFDDARFDVTFHFAFAADYTDFEAFIASYIARREPPYVHLKDGWWRPSIIGSQQMFILLDGHRRSLVTDGRWDWLLKRRHTVPVPSGVADLPIFVTRDDSTGWSLIQLIEPGGAFALSPNVFAPAHDLALVGRSVKSGEQVAVRVRLLYRQISDFAQVTDLYDEFLRSLKT